MTKLLLIPILFYMLILAGLFFAQTSILFPAHLAGGTMPLPPGSARLEVAARDGAKLRGAHVAAARAGEGAVLLVFAGNAWNADAAADYVHGLFPERDVVAFQYRGYAPSEGRPSAKALQEDAIVVHDAVRERFGGRPIVALGFSVGTGVAPYLARHRPLAGLILVTPFDELARVAAGHYPWLPVRLLFRHRMRPIEDLAAVEVPVALFAAERDTLIPPERTAPLRAVVRNLVLDRIIAGEGHDSIYHNEEFRAAAAEALRLIESRSRAGAGTGDP
jgi:hypothetical protein